MGALTTAIYESFNIEEDFAEEVAETADESVQENPIEEGLTEAAGGSIWDRIAPALQESMSKPLTESATDIGSAIDQFYKLLQQDVPPQEARAKVLGEGPVQESLKESKELDPKKRYDPDKHIKKVCEAYRKDAGFGLDEELTEEKLKNEGWRITNHAMRGAITSARLKEALLKGVKNED